MIRLLLALVVVCLWHAPAGAQVTRLTTSVARGAIGTGTCLVTRCHNVYAISLSSATDIVSMEGNTMAAPYPYAHANDMIAPSAGRSGVTVRCEVDGGCALDGGFARVPVNLNNTNSNWTFEGFNACCSSSAVVRVFAASNNNTFRRIIARDAMANTNITTVQHDASYGNLWEDSAVFGAGRKSGGGGTDQVVGNTFRRMWYRWECSLAGASLPVTISYKSENNLFEDILVTVDATCMPQNGTFAATDPPYTNYAFKLNSFLTIDRIEKTTTPKLGNNTVRGAIVYVPATARISPTTSSALVDMFGESNLTLSDIVVVMAPTHTEFNNHSGFILRRRPHNCPGLNATASAGPCEDPVTGNTATRLTSIRGTRVRGTLIGDSFGTNGVSGQANETDWTVTNTSVGTSSGAVNSPWQNTLASSRNCYRTVDGVTGTTPLWPWPMNDRILAATGAAGTYSLTLGCPGCTYSGTGPVARTATNVTADIEALLGVIPVACRGDGAVPEFPDATGFPAQGVVSTFP